MGLFEALLVAFAGQIFLAVVVLGVRRPRRANLISLVVLAPLAAHLALEGARWQMAAAYVAAVGVCAAGVIRFLRADKRGADAQNPATQGPGPRGAALSRISAVLGLLLLVASVVASTMTRAG